MNYRWTGKIAEAWKMAIWDGETGWLKKDLKGLRERERAAESFTYLVIFCYMLHVYICTSDQFCYPVPVITKRQNTSLKEKNKRTLWHKTYTLMVRNDEHIHIYTHTHTHTQRAGWSPLFVWCASVYIFLHASTRPFVHLFITNYTPARNVEFFRHLSLELSSFLYRMTSQGSWLYRPVQRSTSAEVGDG